MKLSIIVPVLNEAQVLPLLLERLLPLLRHGCEVIIADGGSSGAAECHKRSFVRSCFDHSSRHTKSKLFGSRK